VNIPVDMIRSGDTFHIRRLDGVDPMITWAMGSATGNQSFFLIKRPYDNSSKKRRNHVSL